jgi:hypothetical protein
MQSVVVSPQLTVQLYESIKDMPAALYQTARQYEVMAAELGQNEAEHDQMLAKAENYAVTGKIEEFKEEMRNYRLARMLTKDKFQAGQLDWACHLFSVNGERITDYSEDALIACIDTWSALGLTQQLIEETLADVKKNGRMN